MMKEKRRGLTIKVMTDGGDMIRCRNFLMRIPRNLMQYIMDIAKEMGFASV